MVRAQMVYAVGNRYGISPGNARKLAIAIEYFHTTSLIFDDLPGMDDAAKRRGAPCLHRTHGEATAILAALGLVNRAYALAWQVILSAPKAQAKVAGDYLEKCLGVAGGSEWPKPGSALRPPAREGARAAQGGTGKNGSAHSTSAGPAGLAGRRQRD